MATWTTDPVVIAIVNAIAALCNGGSVKFHNAAHAVLASCAFSATAFAAANGSGVAMANAMTVSGASGGGTIDHAHIYKSDGTTVLVALTCGVAAEDVVLSELVLAAGDTVFIRALSLSG